MDTRRLEGCSPWGPKELDTPEILSTNTSTNVSHGSALPLEKCLFWAPKVTAEEQPWKVLVGRQLPPMQDLMRQVSTQEFDLFQIQRNSVTRLLPTFLVTLRYS